MALQQEKEGYIRGRNGEVHRVMPQGRCGACAWQQPTGSSLCDVAYDSGEGEVLLIDQLQKETGGT